MYEPQTSDTRLNQAIQAAAATVQQSTGAATSQQGVTEPDIETMRDRIQQALRTRVAEAAKEQIAEGLKERLRWAVA